MMENRRDDKVSYDNIRYTIPMKRYAKPFKEKLSSETCHLAPMESHQKFLRVIIPNGLRLETGIHMEKSEIEIKCINLLATLLNQWDDIKSGMLVRGLHLEVFLHMTTWCPKGHPL